MTPQESMELIARMIQNSKQRIVPSDLRISVMWSTLTIVTAACAWILIATSHNPLFNFVWLAIPAIGVPAQLYLASKNEVTRTSKTYIDKVREGLWKAIGYIAIELTIACLIAQLCGYPQAWLAMLYYAFIIVGCGATVNGLLLREKTYIFGGMISIFAGFAIIICTLCHIPLLYSWVIPLYILCFFLMFIVPALNISRKNKTERNERA